MDIGSAPELAAQPAASPAAASPPIVPGLTGISETMLWSLHNRACEARRPDGILRDPDAMKIHDAIDYDFEHHFGKPGGSLAARAAQIDLLVRRWLLRHPDGTIVSLGEGLETQNTRVDNGRMTWLSIDLPPAISLRERFITPTKRFRHLAASALAPDWMEDVDPSAGLCIIAQGLLMYLPPTLVAGLFATIAETFPGATMIFDTVPRWFSRLTMDGLNQTPHYRLPPMPWGIDRDQIAATLQTWHSNLSRLEFLDYRAPRGPHRYAADLLEIMPVYRHEVPSLVKVHIAEDG